MEEKISKQNIDKLDVGSNIINTLKENNIKTIGQLCKKTKSDLKKINMESFEINEIEIKLQLLGFDLKNSL